MNWRLLFDSPSGRSPVPQQRVWGEQGGHAGTDEPWELDALSLRHATRDDVPEVGEARVIRIDRRRA